MNKAFAKLDSNNKITNVHIVDESNAATEAKGEAYLRKLYWETDTIYKQTDTRTIAGIHLDGGTPFRKNYATVGGTYDAGRDAFLPPQDFPSWTLNETTCQYDSPSPHPEGEGEATWNEAEGKWDVP